MPGSPGTKKSTLRAHQMAPPGQPRTTQGELRPILRDAFLIPHIVMDAVADARRTPGRRKTGGVPPKPPATILLSLWPSTFWDFGSLYQRRCGVISHAQSRKPCFSSMSLRRLRLCVPAQASRNIAFQMFLQPQTLRRLVSRPVAAGVPLSQESLP